MRIVAATTAALLGFGIAESRLVADTPLRALNPKPIVKVDVQYHRACPSGFVPSTVTEGKCQAVHLHPLIKTCPKDITITPNEKCIQTTKLSESCPAGYVRSGASCVQKVSAPATPVCPIGSTLKNGVCERSIPKDPFCPEGYPLSADGRCTQEVPPVWSCPSGYEKVNNQCLVTYAPKPLCPSGYTVEGSTCKKTVVGLPSCPEGFNMGATACQRFDYPKLQGCPEGFAPSPRSTEICEQITKTIPAQVCHAGVLEEASKKCRSEIPQNPFCPAGYVASGVHNKCQRLTGQVPKCPAGHTRSVGTNGATVCVKTVPKEKEVVCPVGYTLKGSACEKEETAAVLTRCPAGSETRGEGCVVARTVPADYKCEEHFSLDVNRTKCVRPFTVDCSVSRFEKECQPEKHVKVSVPSVTPSYYLRRLSTSSTKGMKCRNIEIITPKKCNKLEITKVIRVCADGTISKDGNCTVYDDTPKESYCPTTYVLGADGRCTRIDTAPLQYQCPVGTTTTGSGCSVVEEVPIEFECPAGYDYNTGVSGGLGKNGLECVQFTNLVRPAPQVVSVDSTPVCQSGSLVGESCVHLARVPRPRKCPAGTVPAENGLCLEEQPIAPARVDTKNIAATLICDNGAAPTGGKCVVEAYHRDYTCPEGSETASVPGGHASGPVKCLKTASLVQPGPGTATQPPSYVCPAGHAKTGLDECSKENSAPVVKSCPEGYEQGPLNDTSDGLGCIKLSPLNVSCPEGFQQTEDICKKVLTADEIVTVIKTTSSSKEPGVPSKSHGSPYAHFSN